MKLGRYRHYKGKEYEVMGMAYHSETLEEMVIYRPLYKPKDEFKDGYFWVRPVKMFEEMVEWKGKKVKRFEFVGAGLAPALNKNGLDPEMNSG
jgi:hypothetical protein